MGLTTKTNTEIMPSKVNTWIPITTKSAVFDFWAEADGLSEASWTSEADVAGVDAAAVADINPTKAIGTVATATETSEPTPPPTKATKPTAAANNEALLPATLVLSGQRESWTTPKGAVEGEDELITFRSGLVNKK